MVCDKELADGGGTSNLLNHIKRKHVEEARKCFSDGDAADKKQMSLATFASPRSCHPDRAPQITMLIAEVLEQKLT